MIGRDGPAIDAAANAAMAVLKFPQFRLGVRARSALKIVDARCIGLHKPGQGFVDHVILSLQTSILVFDVYALMTFGAHGPLSAELFIYKDKEIQIKTQCSFKPDGTPDPWANR